MDLTHEDIKDIASELVGTMLQLSDVLISHGHLYGYCYPRNSNDHIVERLPWSVKEAFFDTIDTVEQQLNDRLSVYQSVRTGKWIKAAKAPPQEFSPLKVTRPVFGQYDSDGYKLVRDGVWVAANELVMSTLPPRPLHGVVSNE